MTAVDASAEPVSVEVPNHEPKETETLLIDLTTPSNSADNEATLERTGLLPPEQGSTSTAQCPSSSENAEEEKDDKEDEEKEEQGEAEQRVPADIATQRRMEQEEEIKTSSKEIIEPMKMLKKGATAVVGGTMVGVGLVMIPLPTPCGCVIASSGLAVLGSEFEGAANLNDQILEKSKDHLVKARDKVIDKIESMNSNDDDTDDESEDSAELGEEAPAWLHHMNEAERKRQRKLLKQKYRDEQKTTNEQFKEFVTKRTGNFLSRTLLPVLNRTKEGPSDETTVESKKEVMASTELKVVDTSSSTPATSTAMPSTSESFQKGKEQMKAMFNSTSAQKGKEQMMAMYNSTSASFSSMMNRMSPQSQPTDESNMDFEEVSFAEVTDAPAFKADDASTAPIAATVPSSGTNELAAASVVAI